VITAAKIIGEAGDIRRFRSPAAFVRHNGTAPVPALLERRGHDKHETRKASLRVLKRHLSDVIYRAFNADAWRLDQPAPHAA
jgi:transposase